MSSPLLKLQQELSDLEEQCEEGDWIPQTSTGKQHTPNQIRGQIRKYLATHNINQTQFM